MSEPLPALEQRVRRLEDAVATLQDVRQIEERIVERVAERLHVATLPAPPEETGGAIVATARVPPTPIEATVRPVTAPYHLVRAWTWFDFLVDLRAMYRMFLDPRYHLDWKVRVITLVLLVALLTSAIWVPGISFMPGWLAAIVDKIVDLALAFVLFKILIAEARRYRETAPDLPPAMRL